MPATFPRPRRRHTALPVLNPRLFSYRPRRPAATPGPEPEARQAYLEEALATASALAGTLAYLSSLHSRPGGTRPSETTLRATFDGLRRQAESVVGFLEDCR